VLPADPDCYGVQTRARAWLFSVQDPAAIRSDPTAFRAVATLVMYALRDEQDEHADDLLVPCDSISPRTNACRAWNLRVPPPRSDTDQTVGMAGTVLLLCTVCTYCQQRVGPPSPPMPLCSVCVFRDPVGGSTMSSSFRSQFPSPPRVHRLLRLPTTVPNMEQPAAKGLALLRPLQSVELTES
jgi:hypothetical protein